MLKHVCLDNDLHKHHETQGRVHCLLSATFRMKGLYKCASETHITRPIQSLDKAGTGNGKTPGLWVQSPKKFWRTIFRHFFFTKLTD